MDKELFLTDHVYIHSVVTILGKCNVYTMDEYKELDEVKEEDYFCRVEYECTCNWRLYSNALMVHCKCEMPENPDVEMIKCEECGTWFHPACVDTKQVLSDLGV